MALNAICREERTRAIPQADGFVAGGDERAQQVTIGNRAREISGLAQGLDLIRGCAAVIVIAIELRRVEAERVAALGRVARQALGPTRVMPGLRAHDAAV